MPKKLIAIFIFLSFITHPISEPGTHPIFSRLVFSDILGALALFFGLPTLIVAFKIIKKISLIYTYSFILVLCCLMPIAFSYNIKATLVECLIIVFLILISAYTFQSFKDNFLDKFVPLLCYTIIVAAVLGIYDLIAGFIGLPLLFPQRTAGEALSGFRNAGQAGAYFLVFITLLYPLKFSKLNSLLNLRTQKLLTVALVLSFIFLGLTGKIAAYIGIIVGLASYAIMRRNIKVFSQLTILILFGSIIYFNLESIAPATYQRIMSKYNSRVVANLENENDNQFLESNIGGALRAFEERPLIGSGLGAFAGNFTRHEVHSTYFKMIGEAGLFGVIGYIFFIFSFLKLFSMRKYEKENPFSHYLYIMYPFIFGCLISWGYTYHLRKREFWIMVSVLLIINYLAIIYNKKYLKINKEKGYQSPYQSVVNF